VQYIRSGASEKRGVFHSTENRYIKAMSFYTVLVYLTVRKYHDFNSSNRLNQPEVTDLEFILCNYVVANVSLTLNNNRKG
jgi:hypothetical protein